MTRHRIDSVWGRFDKPDEYYDSTREKLLELLPTAPTRILDLGCGSGRTWQGTESEVHGVERDKGAAKRARNVLKEVHQGDLETLCLPYRENSFDCLIFADVLEHLYDPWGALLRYRPLLAEDGVLLLSIPNIRYYRALQPLLFRADFPYQRRGVQDIDHLRFFARRNVEWLVQQTGFQVCDWKDNRRGSRLLRGINRALFGSLDDLLTKQFLICARRDPTWEAPGTSPPVAKALGRRSRGSGL